MSTFTRINTFSNKFSDNMLPITSVFNDDTVLNVTSGSGTCNFIRDREYGSFANMSVTSYNTTAFNFNFGDALKTVIDFNGNYFFQLSFFNFNTTPEFFVPFEFYVDVYKDGVLSETIEGQMVSNPTLNSEKTITFAQNIVCNAIDELDFAFRVGEDVTYPFTNITFSVGNFKLEHNNKFLSAPTPYSLPINYYLNDINNFVFVDAFEKLPAPISGVINLPTEKTYYFTKNIDLLGNRIVCGENTPILGSSSENASITSTGLGVGIPLITSIYTNPIRNISIKDVDTALSFDGTTNPSDMALDWTGVNFVNVPNVGLIKKASNFIFDKGAFLNSKGLKFDGTIGTVALNNSLFAGDGLTGNILEVLSTCTITRRFRVTYSSFVVSSLTKGISFNTSAVVPVESYILDTVNFSGGGTYLDGVTVFDNKTLFTNCKGISNTAEVSSYYMNGNATTTVISGIGTPVKALGTTTSSAITQKFTNTNNRATYTGSLTRLFSVTITLSVESGNNNQIGGYIAKNGTLLNNSEVYGTTSGAGRAENIVIQTLVELSTNDYIECFVENGTSITNILVTNLNAIVR